MRVAFMAQILVLVSRFGKRNTEESRQGSSASLVLCLLGHKQTEALLRRSAPSIGFAVSARLGIGIAGKQNSCLGVCLGPACCSGGVCCLIGFCFLVHAYTQWALLQFCQGFEVRSSLIEFTQALLVKTSLLGVFARFSAGVGFGVHETQGK